METVEKDRPSAAPVIFSMSPQLTSSEYIFLAMEDLSSAVSLEQEEDDNIVNQLTMNLSDSPSAGKKRKREDYQRTTINMEELATKRPINEAPTTTATISLSSDRRRSPRKCCHEGEMRSDFKTTLTVHVSKQDLTSSTPPASTPTTRTTLLQPLFSFQQQHDFFSPGMLRTPNCCHKLRHHNFASTPRKSPPSILCKRTQFCIGTKHSAKSTTSSTETKTYASQIDTHLTATSLAASMKATVCCSIENSASYQMEDNMATNTDMLHPDIGDTATIINVEELHYRLSMLFPKQKYPHMRSKVRLQERKKVSDRQRSILCVYVSLTI
jgi:hypothetical protein